MKIKIIKERDPNFVAYSEYMAKTLSEIKREKPTPSNKQCASTQSIIDDPGPREHIAYRHTDPEKAKADKYHVGSWSVDQISLIEDIRCKGRNSLGVESVSSVSSERKQKATDAFRFSEPSELTPLEIQRVTKIEPIVEVNKIEVWKTLTTWEAFKHWLKGGKVRSEPKNED